MAKKKIVGKYEIRYNKNNRPYYIERKSGNRVKESTFTNYSTSFYKQRREIAKQVSNKRWRSRGKFIAADKQGLLVTDLVKRRGLTYKDAKESVNKWDKKTFKKTLDYLVGKPIIPEWMVVEEAIPSQMVKAIPMINLLKKGGYTFTADDDGEIVSLSSKDFVSAIKISASEAKQRTIKEGNDWYRSVVEISLDRNQKIVFWNGEIRTY